jgi:hypothetical protein
MSSGENNTRKWVVQNNFVYRYRVSVKDKEGNIRTEKCFHANDIKKKFPEQNLDRSIIYRIKHNKYLGDKYDHIKIESIHERRPAKLKVQRTYEFKEPPKVGIQAS